MEVVKLLFGMLMCLFGNKLRNIISVILWFLIGFNLSQYIFCNFIDNNVALIIVNCLVGLMLGGAGVRLEKLTIAVAVGYIVFMILPDYVTFNDESMLLAVRIAFSLIAGLLSMYMVKTIFIIATSVYGGTLLAQSIPTFIPQVESFITPIIIVIVVMCILIQHKISD